MPLCVGKRWRLAIWALTNSLLISRYLRIRVAPPEFKGYVRALDLKLVQNPRVMRDVSVWAGGFVLGEKCYFCSSASRDSRLERIKRLGTHSPIKMPNRSA